MTRPRSGGRVRCGCSTMACPTGRTPVVMFVPSQINRAWVLDLLPGNSMLRWLAAEAGLRPLLLDWGTPGSRNAAMMLPPTLAVPCRRRWMQRSA